MSEAKKDQACLEGAVLHKMPSELEPHPVIKYLEDNGVFPMSQADIEKMVKSISELGYLQPITITYDPKEQKYYRIIGRRRMKAAEILCMSVPCYVRYFSSEEEIVEAWKTENFIRAQYSTVQQLQEVEKINKIWSNRTIQRIKNVSKIDPELKKLVAQGILKVRADEEMISCLSALPEDVQKGIAEAFKNNKVVTTQYKDKIKKVVMDEELQKKLGEKEEQFQAAQKELVTAQKRLHASEQRTSELEDLLTKRADSAEEIQNLMTVIEQNKKVMTEEIKKKDEAIAKLQKEKYDLYEEMGHRIDEISEKQSMLVQQLISRLKSDVTASMTSIGEEVESIDVSEKNRGKLFVIIDSLDKTKNAINAEIAKLDKKIRDKLVHIEEAQVEAKAV
ncbi:MAG: ParB N-terminal domain-containing protein [Nitrospirae bacterium]|nr:ParB N-terminal domain-containing protein [Nitrospirota bacterium]